MLPMRFCLLPLAFALPDAHHEEVAGRILRIVCMGMYVCVCVFVCMYVHLVDGNIVFKIAYSPSSADDFVQTRTHIYTGSNRALRNFAPYLM